MNDAPANPLAGPEREGSWPRTRWLTLIALLFAAQVGFIFALGARRPAVPRTAAHVPTLQLADGAGELLALDDPTLFALPHQQDSAAAVWLKMPAMKLPSFRWTEPPRWLPLSSENLGVAFQQFMQAILFAGYPLDFKPPPKFSTPTLTPAPVFAQNSTLRVEGGLAPRQLPSRLNLPNWPYADVIAPSKVQVLVDPAGDVVSAVLLPANNNQETAGHYDAADQRALELARTLRFTPAPRLAVGRVIFNWHTVPLEAATNEQAR